MDSTRGIAYFAGGGAANIGEISRVQLSTWTEIDSLSFVDQILSGVGDTLHDFAYFGTFGGVIMRVSMNNFSVVDQISTNHVILNSAGIDQSGMNLTITNLISSQQKNIRI